MGIRATSGPGGSIVDEERGDEKAKGAVDCCILYEGAEHAAEPARTTLVFWTGHLRNHKSDNLSVGI